MMLYNLYLTLYLDFEYSKPPPLMDVEVLNTIVNNFGFSGIPVFVGKINFPKSQEY